MSLKVTFKGFIERVEDVSTSKNGKLFRKILIRKPAFVDEFGEQRGKDQYFELYEFKNSEQDFEQYHTQDKAEVTAYVNGYENVGNDGIFYTMMMRLKELKTL